MNWQRFKELRLDLDSVYGFEPEERILSSYNDSYAIYLYIKYNKNPHNISLYFKKDQKGEWEATIEILDEYFLGKTEKEEKILP